MLALTDRDWLDLAWQKFSISAVTGVSSVVELLERNRQEEPIEISCCFAKQSSRMYMLCFVHCLREMEQSECVWKETARTGRM